MCFDLKALEKQWCMRSAGADEAFLGDMWGALRNKQFPKEEHRNSNGLSKDYLLATSSSGHPLPFSCEAIKSGVQ